MTYINAKDVFEIVVGVECGLVKNRTEQTMKGKEEQTNKTPGQICDWALNLTQRETHDIAPCGGTGRRWCQWEPGLWLFPSKSPRNPQCGFCKWVRVPEPWEALPTSGGHSPATSSGPPGALPAVVGLFGATPATPELWVSDGGSWCLNAWCSVVGLRQGNEGQVRLWNLKNS